ncbi:hypothetical protein [Actinomadura roseirufa]|uniref:hypothetical protein n=1 Tax=Actinomadura roseirufa TaxID=2094049 RepID=UPI00104187AC|nr:hypothetical protein [Actinomadura roseirufa]
MRFGNRIRRCAVGSAVTLLAVAATTAAVRPADAAGPPAITSLICEQLGRTSFSCDATWSGGTEPATWNWSVTNGGITRTAILNGNPHTLYAAGICNVYSYYTVQLTVTDATNTSTTAAHQYYCRSGGNS